MGAASNLVAAQQASCQANQRASDCDRRARKSEAEHARCTADLRQREAEAAATAAAAKAAAEALQISVEAHQAATRDRDQAVAAAHQSAQDARNAEAALTDAAASEHAASMVLSKVHSEATSSQVGYAGIGNTRSYSSLRYPVLPLGAPVFTPGIVPGRGKVAVEVGADGVARVAL